MSFSLSRPMTVTLSLLAGLVVGLVLAVLLVGWLTSIVEHSKEMAITANADIMTRVVAQDIEAVLEARGSSVILEGDVAAISASLEKFLLLDAMKDIRIVNVKNKVIYPRSPDSDAPAMPDMCAMGHDIGSGKENPSSDWETADRKIWCSLRTIYNRAGPVGGVRIHRSTQAIRSEVDRLRWTMAGGIAVVFVLLYSSLGLLAVQANRQIRQAREHEEQNARLVTVGNLAAGVAHEIKNPLNAIGLTTQYLSRKLEASGVSELEDELRIIRSEIDRLTGIIDDFTRLAKPATLQRRPEDPARLVREVVDLFKDRLTETGIETDVALDSLPTVPLDPAPLRGVFTNLIKNAIEAMPDGGRLTISGDDRGDRIGIRVTDTGSGIAREQAKHLFEPYFTTKPDGLGLGLALARRVVEAHGGTIAIDSEPGQGSTFTVTISKTVSKA